MKAKFVYVKGTFISVPPGRAHFEVADKDAIRLFIDDKVKFIVIKFDPILRDNSIARRFEAALNGTFPDYTWQYFFNNFNIIRAGFWDV